MNLGQQPAFDSQFKLLSSAISDRGLSEKRPVNEDSYLEMPERGIYAVADGVGGAQAGDFASQMAMEVMGEAFSNLPPGSSAEAMMEAAISRANGAIYQMSRDLPQLATMATTIVALYFSGGHVVIGHAGDSRAYRLDPRGDLYRETQDHSVVEEAVRAGTLTPEQAAIHPSRNVISRALGAESSVEVDVRHLEIEPNTTFLLCSDGVTRHISDQEIHQLLYSGWSPNQICLKIKEICYARGAEDNLTAVIVRVLARDAEDPSSAEVHEVDTVATARAANPVSAALTEQAKREAERIQLLPDTAVTEDPFKPERNPSLEPPEASTTLIGMPKPQIAFEIEEETEPKPGDTVRTWDGPDTAEDFVDTTDLRVGLPESVTEAYQTSELGELPAETKIAFEEEVEMRSTAPLETAAEPTPGFSHIRIESNERKDDESSIFGSLSAYDRDERTLVLEEGKGSLLGRVISAFLWICVGVALAFAGKMIYDLAFPPVQPEQITEMKSTNPEFTEFEESRRNVDRDPQKFIQAMANVASDSEDYYLLARAYIILGKNEDAKIALQKAKARIDQATQVNREALENDINFALITVNTPFSETELRKFYPKKGMTPPANVPAANANAPKANSANSVPK